MRSFEPEEIKLFYVMDSDDGGEDRSLMVRETALHRALSAWRDYYQLRSERIAPARVVVVPIDPVIGAIPWRNFVDVYPVPKSTRARKARKAALSETRKGA